MASSQSKEVNRMTTAVYTVKELAERWRCSRDIIQDLLADKRLRGFKVGRNWRIAAAEVERYERGEV